MFHAHDAGQDRLGIGLFRRRAYAGIMSDTRRPADSVDWRPWWTSTLSSNPVKVLESTVRALTPGGRVVLVEYGGDDLNVPISRRTR